MFISRTMLKEIAGHIETAVVVVECEKCGCLLNKKTAYQGKSVIKYKSVERYTLGIYMGDHKKEYIAKQYFCKMHKPKKGNANK